MARTDNLKNFLNDVAESIKIKKGIVGKISASKFDEEIASITGGSTPILQSKEARPTISSQRIKPDEGYDGLSEVLVKGINLQRKSATPKTTTQEIIYDESYDGLAKVTIEAVTSDIDTNIVSTNIRKGISILGVEGNLETIDAPSGNIEITANGNYDVAQYATASVQVGATAVTKGFIINEFDSNGYATDITILGFNTIPSYYIGGSADAGRGIARYLKNVVSNDATKIGTYAFYNCISLNEANFPKVTSIDDYVFYGCSKLKKITTDELTSIGQNAFRGCSLFELTELSDTIETIEQYAFYGCSKVALTKLPSNLTSLGSYVFQNCSALAIKEIPSGITMIGNSTFRGCTALTEVTALGNLTQVTSFAFNGCSNLTKFVMPNITSVPKINASYTSVFAGTPIASGTGYIYTPDALVEEFKESTYWTSYANQIKGLSELE